MPTADNIIVGGARVFIGASDADGSGYTDSAAYFTTTGATLLATKSVTEGFNAGGTAANGLAGYATSAFKEVGFTTEGIDLSFEPEFSDVEVDQLLDSAILFKTSQKVNFKTSLAEATLVNLARAIGQLDTEGVSGGNPGVVTSDATWGDTAGDTRTLGIKGGSLGDFPAEKSIVAVANGPRSVAGKTVERVFEAYRAISVESVGVAVKRNEVTSFPVSFRCLPATNGRYMKIADRVYG
jgi:stage V sporulation protein SpoVS